MLVTPRRCLWTMGLVLILLSAANAQNYAIKAGAVYTVGGEVLRPGMVLVTDGKIAAVAETVDVPAGVELLDLGDGCLMPGLVDAYSRVGVTGGADERTREITPNFSLLDSMDWESNSFERTRSEGVTTLGLMPGSNNVVTGLATVAKTGGAPSKRVVKKKSGLVVTVASDPGLGNRARSRPDSIYVRQPTNRMGVVWLLRATMDAVKAGRRDLPNVKATLDGSMPVYGLSRTHFDMQALFDIGDEFGFRPTIVGGLEAYRIVDQLVERKAAVILGPVSTGAIRGSEGAELCWNQAGILARNEVMFAIAGGNVLEQARFAHRFGLDDVAAIRAVTLAPAQILGVDQRVGSIAVGKDADLVALDGEPLQFTSAVSFVMIDGRLYREGRTP